ncbi:MAG: hypothetical protein IJX36_02185, partial [Thermoguttaceae bacterium]|nr:hypothetical protein [Thermoguttaceae bacterium]
SRAFILNFGRFEGDGRIVERRLPVSLSARPVEKHAVLLFFPNRRKINGARPVHAKHHTANVAVIFANRGLRRRKRVRQEFVIAAKRRVHVLLQFVERFDRRDIVANHIVLKRYAKTKGGAVKNIAFSVERAFSNDVKTDKLGKIRNILSSDIKCIGQEARVLRGFLRKKSVFFYASLLIQRIGKTRVFPAIFTV